LGGVALVAAIHQKQVVNILCAPVSRGRRTEALRLVPSRLGPARLWFADG